VLTPSSLQISGTAKPASTRFKVYEI